MSTQNVAHQAQAVNTTNSDNKADQNLMQGIEELNRKQQNLYPLINRLRQRIELQRRFVATIGTDA